MTDDNVRASGCFALWICLVGAFVCCLTGFVAGYLARWFVNAGL